MHLQLLTTGFVLHADNAEGAFTYHMNMHMRVYVCCSSASVCAKACSFLTMHALSMHARVKMVSSESPDNSRADLSHPLHTVPSFASKAMLICL